MTVDVLVIGCCLSGAALADAEAAGPRGGHLQCEDDPLTCVWADNSGIVVVSLVPPWTQAGPVVEIGEPTTEPDSPP